MDLDVIVTKRLHGRGELGRSSRRIRGEPLALVDQLPLQFEYRPEGRVVGGIGVVSHCFGYA